jgi:hypothetical protein
MENAQEILVIFLSAALAIFLLLNIILLVVLIKVARHIKRISEKAEAISDKAGNVAEFLASAATPMFAGKVVSNIMDAVFGRRGAKRKKRG